MQLANGSLVTGAELKALWSRADFVLNENGNVYANGGILGESALNGGNPQISLNISTIVGYDNNPGGMAYVIAHELGHLTAAGQAANNARSPDNEMIANDVARAISNLEGITPMVGPGGGGYSQALRITSIFRLLPRSQALNRRAVAAVAAAVALKMTGLSRIAGINRSSIRTSRTIIPVRQEIPVSSL